MSELSQRITDARVSTAVAAKEAIAKAAAKKVVEAIKQGGCGITANVERIEQDALVEAAKKAVALELGN